MQRWIAIGVVAIVLFLGGSYFAYRTYQQNRPHPVWVPLPINPQLESAKRDQIIKDLKTKLSNPDILVKVSDDVGLAKTWNLASNDLCATEIAKRLFVRSGDADTPMGKVPAILVGINGKEKESVISEKITMRLMDDVWMILGIKPPQNNTRSDPF